MGGSNLFVFEKGVFVVHPNGQTDRQTDIQTDKPFVGVRW